MLKKNSYSKKSTVPSSKSLNVSTKRPITSLQRIRCRMQNELFPESKPKNTPVTSRRLSINTTNKFFNPRGQKSQKSNYFNQLLSNPQVIHTYLMMSHIGKGCFSVVHLAVHRFSRKPYAIKAYEKIDSLQWYRLQNLKRQIVNLQRLQHPNVVGLIDTVKDKQKIYLIMENGGKQSLSGLLRKQKKFSQNQVKFYFKQILSGMAYCHQKGVCHRDLKLQNILVDDEGNVKIIDFGFSHRTNKKLSTYCGTPPYMCPQIVKKSPYFGAGADVWALGVLFYLMLCGTFPFRASNEQELYRLIQQGKYQFKQEISNGAKDFLSNMLQTNPINRATTSQLLSFKWLG